MKKFNLFLLIILFPFANYLFSQDTTVTWIRQINPEAFKGTSKNSSDKACGFFNFRVDFLSMRKLKNSHNAVSRVFRGALKISLNKWDIPKSFFQTIGIEKLWQIAGPYGFYHKACIGFFRFDKFHWLAKDNSNHWIICVSHGGFASGDDYFFFDFEKGSVNVNALWISSEDWKYLKFHEVLTKIRKREYEFKDINFSSE